MHPALTIRFLHTKIKAFHFFGVLGYFVGAILGVIISVRLSLQFEIILLLGMVGAATFFFLVYISKWLTGEEIIVYYHHEISILIFCILTLYFLKLPILPYIDIVITGIGVFLAFGRIGCYSVGCCHGRPHRKGIVYGQKHVDAGFTWFYKDVALLPVQLIESSIVFSLVVAVVVLLLNHVEPGTTLLVYSVIYGAIRFLIEYFRGDPERPILLGLSEAQLTSLTLIAITYGFSKIGWLPVYSWHWIILSFMLSLSVVTIYRFVHNPENNLFNPSHIGELAEALIVLDQENANSFANKDNRINIYTTSAGLSISSGRSNGIGQIKHFTISLKKNRIKQPSVHKLAHVIAILRQLPYDYDLIEKQCGVYHICFIETI